VKISPLEMQKSLISSITRKWMVSKQPDNTLYGKLEVQLNDIMRTITNYYPVQ